MFLNNMISKTYEGNMKKKVLTQIIHRRFENMQVVLISKAFIKFEGIPRRYVENLMNVLETKGRSRVLNFL